MGSDHSTHNRKNSNRFFSTLRNQKKSPLLRIPGELRNNIYEHAYGGMIIRAFTYDDRYPVFDKQSSTRLPFFASDVLNSMTVCHQVHSEIGIIPVLHSELSFNNIAKMSSKLAGFAPRWCGKLRCVRLVATDFFPAINLINDFGVTEHLKGVDLVVFQIYTPLKDSMGGPWQHLFRMRFETKFGRKINVEFE